MIQIHPSLINYYKRFQKEEALKFNKFFTQHQNKDFLDSLPYLFGIERAILRLRTALKQNQKVCIYSDYDTDAVTATGAMYWGLLAIGFKPENLSFYAPDRFTEGYGMNPEAILELSQKNDLIVSVDCGINSTEEAKICRENGCDMIITDHHHLQSEVPDCEAVINPRLNEYYLQKENAKKAKTLYKDYLKKYQKSDSSDSIINFYKYLENKLEGELNSFNYLNSSVTGVGVAWFTILWLAYFLREFDQNYSNLTFSDIFKRIEQLSSLVAIGTVADCQSVLEPTNRLLIRTGIIFMQKGVTGIDGLEELIKQTQIREKISGGYKITSQDLAFYLSPILNSSGRITHAKLSIKTILSPNLQEAKINAEELINVNNERKIAVKIIVDEVDQEAKKQFLNKNPLLWLEGDWGKGLVGLLASRLVSKYGLPVVVVSKEEDGASASLRAPEGYHLPNAMQKAEKNLEKFGGHPCAAGFHTKIDELAKVKAKMEKALKKQDEDLKNQEKPSFLPKDLEDLVPNEIKEFASKENLIWLGDQTPTPEIFNSNILMDPFGQDFPFPSFVFKIVDPVFFWMGEDKKHLKLKIDNLDIVKFNLEDDLKSKLSTYQALENKSDIWIIAKMSQNTWNQKTTFQLIADEVLVVG